MKRSKSSKDSDSKRVKQSTSARHADADISESDIESIDTENSENTEQAEQVTVKCNYKSYFKYEIKNNCKDGICLLCAKENINKRIKMKNSNTTGLKKHLERSHKKVYQELFLSKTMKDKILSEKRKTIDVLLNVSTKIKFYKLCIK